MWFPAAIVMFSLISAFGSPVSAGSDGAEKTQLTVVNLEINPRRLPPGERAQLRAIVLNSSSKDVSASFGVVLSRRPSFEVLGDLNLSMERTFRAGINEELKVDLVARSRGAFRVGVAGVGADGFIDPITVVVVVEEGQERMIVALVIATCALVGAGLASFAMLRRWDCRQPRWRKLIASSGILVAGGAYLLLARRVYAETLGARSEFVDVALLCFVVALGPTLWLSMARVLGWRAGLVAGVGSVITHVAWTRESGAGSMELAMVLGVGAATVAALVAWAADGRRSGWLAGTVAVVALSSLWVGSPSVVDSGRLVTGTLRTRVRTVSSVHEGGGSPDGPAVGHWGGAGNSSHGVIRSGKSRGCRGMGSCRLAPHFPPWRPF